MEITEKVAYLKGLMEGMKIDTETNEGKILSAMVDILEDIGKEGQNARLAARLTGYKIDIKPESYQGEDDKEIVDEEPVQ